MNNMIDLKHALESRRDVERAARKRNASAWLIAMIAALSIALPILVVLAWRIVTGQ